MSAVILIQETLHVSAMTQLLNSVSFLQLWRLLRAAEVLLQLGHLNIVFGRVEKMLLLGQGVCSLFFSPWSVPFTCSAKYLESADFGRSLFMWIYFRQPCSLEHYGGEAGPSWRRCHNIPERFLASMPCVASSFRVPEPHAPVIVLCLGLRERYLRVKVNDFICYNLSE